MVFVVFVLCFVSVVFCGSLWFAVSMGQNNGEMSYLAMHSTPAVKRLDEWFFKGMNNLSV
jgi:hypothetical protein